MLDAVLYELEGVLADIGALRGRAVVRALEARGFVPPAQSHLRGCESTRAAVTRALDAAGAAPDETEIDLLVFIAEQKLVELVGAGVTLAPGAREIVNASAGVTRLAVVTRASRRIADAVLALAQLDAAFECVIAAEDGGADAPRLGGYARALERMHRRRPLRRASTVALVGDAASARAAHAAGGLAIGIGPLAVALRAEADAVLPSLERATPASLDALLAPRAERIG